MGKLLNYSKVYETSFFTIHKKNNIIVSSCATILYCIQINTTLFHSEHNNSITVSYNVQYLGTVVISSGKNKYFWHIYISSGYKGSAKAHLFVLTRQFLAL